MKTKSDNEAGKGERESSRPAAADANGNVELGDADLAEVSGGLTCRKAGKDQQEYLTFNGHTIISI